ncbi:MULTISPECIES: MFS transporter [Rahnella]|uniref:MFS transporter n=1 Tax=Rahnella TaxID=34037 RepID=UPI00055CAB3D|nr:MULTISPECIES: MFS transporter [Rahnella]QQN36429.1 MFS transporter [Rahnella aceris]
MNTTSPVYLTARQTVLFAAAAAFMVANIYYSQPLLAVIGRQFGTPPSDTALLVTLTQLGYGLGVLFLVPLGDFTDRRRLASVMISLCIIALLLTAASQSFWFFASVQLLLGLASSATMVLIPYVASHTVTEERGQRVGQMITGILLGILLARTVSGLVADALSWRAMYLLAGVAATMVLLTVRKLMVPATLSVEKISYPILIRSMLTLLKEHQPLRVRAFYCMMGMGSFSILWTGLTLFLSGEPYHFKPSAIGLFGLIGAAGAMSAGIAGRISDRGHSRILTIVLAVLLLISWMMMAEARTSLLFLIGGILLLDVAAMGLQVVHQSIIYKLEVDAQSRITSIFVTSGFIGMALGSALSSVGFRHWQWTGICVLGAVLPALMLIHLLIASLMRPAAR